MPGAWTLSHYGPFSLAQVGPKALDTEEMAARITGLPRAGMNTETQRARVSSSSGAQRMDF